MSLTRVVVALIALLVIGGVAFLWFSPYLTGEDYLKDFFLHQLEQNLGRKIDVHRVKLVLFPSIRLEMTQIVIHDRDVAAVHPPGRGDGVCRRGGVVPVAEHH